ncbi:hypothetical protein JQ616_31930 [Bradyrhizobium tropiciagri]|uniref:hypothetical protein n=1 Tax=Bradyrhizobium tropiciagri TaxID=312253 RepID=UPI001BA91CFE|nr:hypothetical protein [Bradyrhizobium tropiciagri]MBR0899585.1 hypothetical protein [Bradyrhizobium tropiciagri]
MNDPKRSHALGANSAAIDGSAKVAELTKRFESRAAVLEAQASIFLWMIIGLLFAGAFAFLFAAEIAKFDLGSAPTLAEQYQTADRAYKDNEQSISQIDNLIKQLGDDSAVTAKIDVSIKDAQTRLSALIEPLMLKCAVVHKSYTINPLDFDLGVLESANRKGEFYILAPGSTLYFDSKDSASRCADDIRGREADIRSIIGEINQLQINRSASKSQFSAAQAARIAESTGEKQRFEQEGKSLHFLRAALIDQILFEKLYGKNAARVLPPASGTAAANSETKNDTQVNWPAIIQTNATRYGALLIVFFLVAILVPQYRYNVRLASYYQSRSDLIVLLNGNIPSTEFAQIVAAITPTIDFGKAPKTPIEQLVEVAKLAK